MNRRDVAAVPGRDRLERARQRAGGRHEQVRRALAHLEEHRRDAGKRLGVSAELLRQARDQRPEADARLRFLPGGGS